MRYYICIRGRKPGIFETTWEKFKPLVNEYSGALFCGQDDLKKASIYWTINRKHVSREYFSRNYKNLYPNLKIVEIKDYVKDNDDIIIGKYEKKNNINYNYRKDNANYKIKENQNKINITSDSNNIYNEKEISSSNNTNSIDSDLPKFGGTNPLNEKINNDYHLNQNNISNNISNKNKIISLSARKIPEIESNPLGNNKRVNIGCNIRGKIDSKLNKKNKKKTIAQEYDNFKEIHCDSFRFEGYDATCILDAIDAVIAKIKEMLKP